MLKENSKKYYSNSSTANLLFIFKLMQRLKFIVFAYYYWMTT